MKICAKESNIYRVFSRYESHRDRYSAGLVQFSDTINKILYNVNNVMNNINSSNSYKTDLLIDSLIQICFFQLDSVDLLNIVSLINNHKYKKLAIIKTTMCETNTLGISQIIYYEVACDYTLNCNNKHYYSPLELQKLIDDKRIVLIRKLFSNEIRYGNYEVNFHTFIINDYYHQLFEGFYEEYNYYLNNISNNEKIFFREYVKHSLDKKEILIAINNYLTYILENIYLFFDDNHNSTIEFANLCKNNISVGKKIKKIVKIKEQCIL